MKTCGTDDALEEARARILARRLKVWFDDCGRHFPWRKEGESQYRVIITEVLLKRTRVETVARRYYGFFARFPTWHALAQAQLNEIERALNGFGLWRQRAPHLNALASIVAESDGDIVRAFNSLPQGIGIGNYVGNAIRLFCFGEPAPLMDATMARVLRRYFGLNPKKDFVNDRRFVSQANRAIAAGNPILINWAILDLGALVCTSRKPMCHLCPVRYTCRSAPGLNRQVA